MLVVYPLPDKGYRYPIRRGSGLFITFRAFGDASIEIFSRIVPRFSVYKHLEYRVEGDDRPQDKTMPQLITIGTDLCRINPAKNSIEISRDKGRNWTAKCISNSYGTFKDLCLFGAEIYAVTSKGVYISKDGGRNFSSKCTSSSYGEFQTIMAQGSVLYAQTSKGLYASKDGGRNWTKK